MNEQNQTPRRSDANFLIVAGALVVMILALLAGLWLKADRRAKAAEAQLARCRTEMGLIRGLLQSTPLIPGVNREDLPTRQVVLDGKSVRALRLSAAGAGQIGLKPGDVVLVDQPPSTAPSTQQKCAKPPVTD